MRKLASIQKIVAVTAIPEADKIDCVTILGWKCIVKKGEFKEGDLVIYIEPDSMLPFNPWTGALIPDSPLRLKTVRMKKQISQGLVLSTNLPQLTAARFLTEGTDISAILGITKYEPPPLSAALVGMARGLFPSFIPKTDEVRIQAAPAVLSRWAAEPFTVTEKLDGMSTTYYSHPEGWPDIQPGNDDSYRAGACSRNLDLLPGESVQWKVAGQDKIHDALVATAKKTGQYFAVQGELAGPNIQGNKLKLLSPQFFAFNLYNYTAKKYASPEELTAWCKEYNIKQVPVVSHSFSLQGHTVDSLVAYVTRKSALNHTAWIEGMVFRPLVPREDPDLGNLSFKVINPEFLLSHGE